MDTGLYDAAMPMKIGDEEYKASMFTDKDFGDLEQYIKSVFIRMGVEAAESLNGQGDRLIAITLTKATEIGWMSKEGIAIMASVDGFLHLGFQLIRKRHPKVKFSEFAQEFAKDVPRAMREINLTDRRLNYTTKVEETDVGGSAAENSKSG